MQLVRSIGNVLPPDFYLFCAAGPSVRGQSAQAVSASKPAEAIRRPAWAALVCIAATVFSLAPFAGKAFHVDDTLFLYAARQICAHPADPYGFQVNWYGPVMPMADVAMNPPLASYYLALVGSCLGWSEMALHLAFLIPAAAAVLGTYFLAMRFCREPLLAALTTLLCPVFLVSSTQLMCDTMTLALSVWAVALWLRSAESGSHVSAILSACLIAAASVTKYYAAVSLIPLLLCYSLLRWPRLRWRILYLAIPVALYVGYDLLMRSLYGRSPLFGASHDALVSSRQGGCLWRGVVTLSFAGGCLAPVIFYATLLWPRRALAGGLLVTVLLTALLSTAGSLGDCDLPPQTAIRLLVVAQFSLFVVAGASLLALAVADVWRARDAESALLVLWLTGTFFFCWLVNWTVNGRTILPMAPAASILIVRRIDRYGTGMLGRPFGWKYLPLALVGILAAAVAWADTCWADNARAAAAEMRDRYAAQRANVWFSGHWGFQYYMESAGFAGIDTLKERLLPGNVVIVPHFGSNVPRIPAEACAKTTTRDFASCRCLTTMCPALGAAFYGSHWGLLPFAFGPAPDERYYVITMARACVTNPLSGQREQELKQQPDSAEAYSERGLALAGQGRFEDAIAQYRKALEIKPRYAEACNNLGLALQACGKVDEATSRFQQSLEIKPDFVEAHSNLGMVLAGRGQLDAAIAEYRKALELKPDYIEARNNLGFALAQQGRFDAAIGQYRRALEIAPHHAMIHRNLGNALTAWGRFDDAIVEYQKTLEIQPKDVQAHYSLGGVLAARSRFREATAHYGKALEIEPRYLTAHGALAWLLATCPEASLRDGAAAVEHARRAEELCGGTRVEVLDTLAAAYAEAGRFPDAVATARKALELATRQKNLYLMRFLRAQIALYEAGKPYHEAPAASLPGLAKP
jgi:tetratricopeptide (TPR) repeat protein